MRKILVFILAFAFAISLCTPAFAANGVDLACGYSIKNDNKVTIKIAVVDIKDSTGVAIVDYLIKYDDSVLRLDSGMVNLPKQWEPFTKDEMAENLSQAITGGYRWSVVNCMPGYGIKADNELHITLEFTRLENVETDIEVIYKCVANDEVVEIYGPDKTITVPVSSGDSTSGFVSEGSETNNTDDTDASDNEDSVGSVSDTNNDKASGSNSSDNSSVNDAETTDVWVIILGIFGGIAVIAGIVYLVLLFSKKGNK